MRDQTQTERLQYIEMQDPNKQKWFIKRRDKSASHQNIYDSLDAKVLIAAGVDATHATN